MGSGARSLPHVLAWRLGMIIAAIVGPPSKRLPKVTKSAWPMNCGKCLKTRANSKVFQPSVVSLTPKTVTCNSQLPTYAAAAYISIFARVLRAILAWQCVF